MLYSAELLSLGLTIPALYWSLITLREWYPAFLVAWSAKKKTTHQRLIIGVFISFAGSYVDNLYWGIAWSAAFLELPAQVFLFKYGVLPNIPFRQAPLLIASAFHTLASRLHGLDEEAENRELAVFRSQAFQSIAAGVVFISLLVMIKALT